MTKSLASFKFVFEGILLLPVSVVGVIANVYSVQFLKTKSKEIDLTRSFTNLLILLSLFDLLYLLNAIGLLGLPNISEWYTLRVYKNIAPICVGLGSIGRVGSVCVTVSIAFARYMAVCHPTATFSRKYLLGLLPISFAVLYNIPKFFEITNCSDEEKYLTWLWHAFQQRLANDLTINDTYSNGPNSKDKLLQDFLISPNNTWVVKAYEKVKGPEVLCDKHDHRRANFSNDQSYIIFYKVLSDLIFVEILPWIAVIVLNILVWKKSKQFHQMRLKLLKCTGKKDGQGTNGNNSMQSQILFSIIVMFVFFQCFTIIPDIYELNCALSTSTDKQQCQYTYRYTYHLIEISHLMLAVNSSINFIFYIIHIKLFRENCTKLISKISTCLQTRCKKTFSNGFPKRDCRVETIMMEPNTVMVVSPDVVQQGQEISQA